MNMETKNEESSAGNEKVSFDLLPSGTNLTRDQQKKLAYCMTSSPEDDDATCLFKAGTLAKSLFPEVNSVDGYVFSAGKSREEWSPRLYLSTMQDIVRTGKLDALKSPDYVEYETMVKSGADLDARFRYAREHLIGGSSGTALGRAFERAVGDDWDEETFRQARQYLEKGRRAEISHELDQIRLAEMSEEKNPEERESEMGTLDESGTPSPDSERLKNFNNRGLAENVQEEDSPRVETSGMAFAEPAFLARERESVLKQRNRKEAVRMRREEIDLLQKVRTIEEYEGRNARALRYFKAVKALDLVSDANAQLIIKDVMNRTAEQAEKMSGFSAVDLMNRFDQITDINEKRIVASVIQDFQPEKGKWLATEALVAGWEASKNLLQGIINAAYRPFLDSDEYQAYMENLAVTETAFSSRRKEWGTFGNAVIGAVSTLPYMSAAAIPWAGTGIVAAQAMNELDKQIALEGGDVRGLEHAATSLAFGFAYAGIERLQAFEVLKGRPLDTRRFWADLFTDSRRRFMALGNLGLRTIQTGNAEAIEEAAQKALEESSKQLFLGEDFGTAIKEAGKAAIQEAADALGAMMIVGGVGEAASRVPRQLNGKDLAKAKLCVDQMIKNTIEGRARITDIEAFQREAGDVTHDWLNLGNLEGEEKITDKNGTETTLSTRQAVIAKKYNADAQTAIEFDTLMQQAWDLSSYSQDSQNAFVGKGYRTVSFKELLEKGMMDNYSVTTDEEGNEKVSVKLGGLTIHLSRGETIGSKVDAADTSFGNVYSILNALNSTRDAENKLTVEQWNALPTEERQRMIDEYDLRRQGKIEFFVENEDGTRISGNFLQILRDGNLSVGDGVIHTSLGAMPQAVWHEQMHAVIKALEFSAQTDADGKDNEAMTLLKDLAAQMPGTNSGERVNEEFLADGFRDFLTLDRSVVAHDNSVFGRLLEFIDKKIFRHAEVNVLDKLDVSKPIDALFASALTGKFTYRKKTDSGDLASAKEGIPQVKLKDNAGQEVSLEEAPEMLANGAQIVPQEQETGENPPQMPDDEKELPPVPAMVDKSGAFRVLTPDTGYAVEGVMEVVDINDVRTSDQEGYDGNLQLRNRDTMSSKDQIEQTAEALQPELLGESVTSDMGAPLVSASGDVVSGNGRTMAIKRAIDAYKTYPGYEEFVRNKAKAYNLQIPEGVKHPMLVRRITKITKLRDTDRRRISEEIDPKNENFNVELANVAELSNRPAVLMRTAAEQAIADAGMILAGDFLSDYEIDGGNLLTLANRAFVNKFIREAGNGSLVNHKGDPTPTAAGRIKRALFAAVVDKHPEAKKIIETTVEQADELGMNRFYNGVVQAAPALLRLAMDPAHAQYDISADIADALKTYINFKNSGVKDLESYLSQEVIDTSFKRPALTDAILREMAEAKRSAPQVASLFTRYAHNAMEQITSADDGLFGEMASPREAVWEATQKAVGNSVAEDTSRFSVVRNKDKIDRLNKEETISTYRAMVKIGGEYYPPMATKVMEPGAKKATLQAGAHVGDWFEADERPDLAKQGKNGEWYFPLRKSDGKMIQARYNPYIHTSLTPFNDQFASAQDREDIVIVEMAVPKSELTSGYRAEKAKDTVGEMEWKAGKLTSKLTGTRKVVLSRWAKLVREVPYGEVADKVQKLFDGELASMPFPSNVVHPELRRELEARGRNFIETDNNGNERFSMTAEKAISEEEKKILSRYTNADGTMKPGYMKAPNGKPTNLTEKQWLQVRTPAFKKWFGDWEKPVAHSKVVDENGEPRVVYHGTDEDFTAFDDAYTGGVGFYFAYDTDHYVAREKKNKMAVFLNIKNPVSSETYHRIDKEVDGGGNPQRIMNIRFMSLGYDGIIRGLEIIAFSPSQIKSATDNTGAFDGTNPDIRYSIIGEKGVRNLADAQRVTANLEVARKMERGRRGARAIWFATGWQRGADGKWRYEIPDAEYIFDKNDKVKNWLAKNRLVKKAYDEWLEKWNEAIEIHKPFHSQVKDALGDKYDALLFGNYNTVEEKIAALLSFGVQEELAKKYIDSYSAIEALEKQGKSIRKYPLKPILLKDLIEHPILFKAYPKLNDIKVLFRVDGRSDLGWFNYRTDEIMVAGARIDNMRSTLLHEIQHAIQEYEGFAKGGSPEQFQTDEWRMKSGQSPYELYLRLAGEVEARNAETRYETLSTGERGRVPLSETEDVSRKDQIILGIANEEAERVRSELAREVEERADTTVAQMDEAVEAYERVSLNVPSNDSVKLAKAEISMAGMNASDDSVLSSDVRFSINYTETPDQRNKVAEAIVRVTGEPMSKVQKWMDDVDSLAAIVTADKRLQYDADPTETPVKKNSDYGKTLDFTSICKKRRMFASAIERLLVQNPYMKVSPELLADVREFMKNSGLVVNCGLCYVEGRRQAFDTLASGFIDVVASRDMSKLSKNAIGKVDVLLKNSDWFIPNKAHLLTREGLRWLSENHHEIAEAFLAYNNARGMQAQNLFDNDAEYLGQILKFSESTIKRYNNHGGFRIQSFSDFEAHHLLDMMQAIRDLSSKGGMAHMYTKVPEAAWLMQDTGAKVNISHIAADKGVDAEGNLIYDNIEGVNTESDAYKRIDFSLPNVTANIVGINDDHIRAAMKSPFIGYIIPYHVSGIKMETRHLLGTSEWSDYTDTQVEKIAKENGELVNAPADKRVNIYDLIVRDSNGNMIPKENTVRKFQKRFFEACKKQGVVPRFYQFLNTNSKGEYIYTEGYEKLLVDFKLFDAKGNMISQDVVRPNFNADAVKYIVDKYLSEIEETGLDYEQRIPNDQMKALVDHLNKKGGNFKFNPSKDEVRFSISATLYEDIRNVVTKDDITQSAPEIAATAAVRAADAAVSEELQDSRNSISAGRRPKKAPPTLLSMAKAIASRDVINGKKPEPSDYAQLLAGLGISDKITPEELLVEAQRIAESPFIQNAVSSGLALSEAVEQEALAENLPKLLSGELRRGVDIGSLAERGWNKAVNNLVKAAEGKEYSDIVGDTGLNLVKLISELVSEIEPSRTQKVKVNDDGKIVKEDEDGTERELDDNSDDDSDDSEPEETVPEGISQEQLEGLARLNVEKILANRRAILARMRSIIAERDARKQEHDRKKAERKEALKKLSGDKTSEDDTEDGIAESSEASLIGETSVSEEASDTESEPTMTDEQEESLLKMVQDLLASEKIDITSSKEISLFIRVWVENWIAGNNAPASTKDKVFSDPVNFSKYKKTVKSILSALAEKMVNPNSGFGVNAVRRIQKKIDAITETTKANSIELRTASIIRDILNSSVRINRKKLIESGRKMIDKLLGKKVRDPLDRIERRKARAECEEQAKYLKTVLTWSRNRCNKEKELLNNAISKRETAYINATADSAASEIKDIVSQDALVYKARLRIAMIEKYGGLKEKTPAEIAKALDEIREWITTDMEKHAMYVVLQRQEKDDIAALIQKCLSARGEKLAPKSTERNKVANELIATLRQRLERMFLGSGNEGRNLIDRIMIMVNEGTQDLLTIRARQRKEVDSLLVFACNGTAVNPKTLIRELGEYADETLNQALISQTQTDRMTWGQVLQLYACLCQPESYAENIAENHREGQKELIEKHFETHPEFQRLVIGLRRIYNERRESLSRVFKNVTGMEMHSPDPMYMPARMWMEREGLKNEVKVWRPFGGLFSPRIRNKRDFDLSKDIMSVFSESSEETARTIAWAERGLFLRSVFGRKESIIAMRKHNSKSDVNAFLEQLTDTVSGGYKSGTSPIEKWAQAAGRVTSYAYLSWNIVSSLKQAASLPAFASVLDGGYIDVLKHLATGITDRAALDEFLKSPGFIARYGEATIRDIIRSEIGNPRSNAILKVYRSGMALIQGGDRLAAVYVGAGLYKAKLAQILREKDIALEEAKARALTAAWSAVEEAQQSARPENTISFLRRNGVIANELMKFASSPILQASHEIHAFRMYAAALKSGNTEETQRWRKRLSTALVTNHIVIPGLMFAVGAMIDTVFSPEDDDDKKEEARKNLLATLFIECVLGQFSRYFLVGTILNKGFSEVASLFGLKPEIYSDTGIVSLQFVEKSMSNAGNVFEDLVESDFESFRDDAIKFFAEVFAPAKTARKLYNASSGYDPGMERAKRKRRIRKENGNQ